MGTETLSDLAIEGFAYVPQVLSEAQVEQLRALFDDTVPKAGQRFILQIPEIAELAESEAVRQLVEPALGADAIPVRGLFFDKNPEANWKVPWHQDLTISVKEKKDVQGYGPWSMKDGVNHVQPPVSVLEQMLAVRLHLDPTYTVTEQGKVDNGSLRVIPGSHRKGKLNDTGVSDFDKSTEQLCQIDLGGALLMHPLLLHASSASEKPFHRRVIHIEFAGCKLDGGLEWARY